MKNLLFMCVAMLVVVMAGCSESKLTLNDIATPKYNENVTAYTSGCISRKSSICIVLSKDVSQEKIDSLAGCDLIKLTPSVAGKCSFTDRHTLVFVPSKDLARESKYTVNVALDKIYNGGEPFEYEFLTRPMSVNAYALQFDVTDDDNYLFSFNVNSADVEEGSVIESLVDFSVPGSAEWSHEVDGLKHVVKFKVDPAKSGDELVVRFKGDSKLGVDSRDLLTVDVPSSKRLEVYSVKYKTGETKYIEVAFNKVLDPKQNKVGLAYIRGNKSIALDVENNKIKLYPDANRHDNVDVVVMGRVKGRDGSTLGDDYVVSVDISQRKPEIRFVDHGVIVPVDDRILVPFQSVLMNGVRVKVYKIYGNMVASYLMHGGYDGESYLMNAARPVYATTFYMSDYGSDLSEWQTYAIDLTDQFRMEPGAMYRVELSLDERLSAWPSASLKTASREDVAADDKLTLASLNEHFDRPSGYYRTGYYYDDYYWWNDYDDYDSYYTKRNDPSYGVYYTNKSIGKNVLATNMGLTAYKGVGNEVKVTVLGLKDAQPMSGVEIVAYSAQQQVVCATETDMNGVADVSCDGKNGCPYVVMARHGNDVSYLSLAGNAQSTSTFDVSGETLQSGLRGYIYGDRGVWRPGDDVYLSFMVNDRNNTLPSGHPVSLVVYNPLGQVYQRYTKTNGVLGIYSFTVPIDENAPTGLWTANFEVGGAHFSKNLRIETIKPNRLKIDVKLPEVISCGMQNVKLHTEWLNGAVANGLKYDMSAKIVSARTGWKQWDGYSFDNMTKVFETEDKELVHGEVDNKGDVVASYKVNVSDNAPGMLKCNYITKVYEPSGEFSTDVRQVLLSPYARYVGVKSPLDASSSFLHTDKSNKFDIVSVDKDGKPCPNVAVNVSVYKVNWNWWWRVDDEDIAGYTSSGYNTPVYKYKVNTDANGRGCFSMNVSEDEWGTYLIEVMDVNGGHSSTLLSYFDWPWMTSRRNYGGSDDAKKLKLSTDKDEYKVGEDIKITMPSMSGCRAIVAICNGAKVLSLDTYECKDENTVVEIKATSSMMPNVFAYVSLVQPYSHDNELPLRMYGVVPISVTSPESRLTPVVKSDDEIRPESKFSISVSEKDGREMAYTLAIVDEGLLDLTHFKTPNAWSTFNAREALGVGVWDMYDYVSGKFGGRIEHMFSIGGDEALNGSPKAIVNRFTPMVHFEGPFMLDKGQVRKHSIDVPNYNGRVRIMVVAGDGRAYGSAEKSVLVRRPLMLIGTMPRLIGAGDEVQVSATLFASKKLGEVKVDVSTSSELKVVGYSSSQVNFGEAGDKTVTFRVKAGKNGGVGNITLKASGGGENVDYSTDINIRCITQTLSSTTSVVVESGKDWQGKVSVPGDFDRALRLEASSVKPLNLNNRLESLLGYPHGCVEQTTSKVFPQLYVKDFAVLSDEQIKTLESNVNAGIEKLRNFQTSDGGMAYWRGGGYSDVWASAYVLCFLTEASSKGYFVPEDMMSRLKKYVKDAAGKWTSSSSNWETYNASLCLYALASAGSAELGVMNRLKEYSDKFKASETYLLATSYALVGRVDVANQLLAKEVDRYHYYWCDEDVMRLLAETLCSSPNVETYVEKVRQKLASDIWMSTSEMSLSMVAMSKYYSKYVSSSGMNFVMSVNDKETSKVNTGAYSWHEELSVSSTSASVKSNNKSDGTLFLDITAVGKVTQSHVDKMTNGIDMRIDYMNVDGSSLNIMSIPQSKSFKAHLTVVNVSGRDLEHVAITQMLPAGWEVISCEPSGDISYQDVRDDRVLTYIDMMNVGKKVSVVLELSATYVGKYYLPSISAEAMYDSTVSGCTESGEVEVK